MSANPFIGVLLLMACGLAGGSCYVPFGKVKQWSWETYWLIMGVSAWVIAPWLMAWCTVPHLPEVISNSPMRSVALVCLFGAIWGIGATTFGLTMRYLGISLGMAVSTGLCAAFGTLIPPIVDGQIGDLLANSSGLTVLTGVAVCLAGIAVCGCAGVCKERELTDEQKKESIKDFALVKGFVVAAICGVTSAFVVYGINAGNPIANMAIDLGAADVYKHNTTFALILTGGFLVNTVWCLALNIKNRSIREYVTGSGSLLLRNHLLVALAGILTYGQLFFYGMGTTEMGEYAFSSWSIQTALTLVFGNLWGVFLKEWKGVSRRTLLLLWGSILVLVLSAVIMGAGSYLATIEP